MRFIFIYLSLTLTPLSLYGQNDSKLYLLMSYVDDFERDSIPGGYYPAENPF